MNHIDQIILRLRLTLSKDFFEIIWLRFNKKKKKTDKLALY